MAWEYRVVAGNPQLSANDLNRYGLQDWELVAVLAPHIKSIPVATAVALAANPPLHGPQPSQSSKDIDYTPDSFTYIFKKPGPAATKKKGAASIFKKPGPAATKKKGAAGKKKTR